MKDSRIAKTLVVFSVEELPLIRKYLLRQTTGHQSPIVKLFDTLCKFHPHFDVRKLAMEYLFKKLYRGEKYSKQKLKNNLTTLQQHLENYLIQDELQQSLQQKEWLLMMGYKRRQNLYNFTRIGRQAIQHSEENMKMGANKCLQQLSLYHELYFYAGIARQEQGNKDLPKLVSSLSEFLALRLIAYALDQNVRRKVNQDSTRIIGLETALKYAQTPGAPEITALFAKLWQLYTQGESNDPLYQSTRSSFNSLASKMEEFEKGIAFKTFINYLIPLAKGYRQPYLDQLYALFVEGYEKQYLLVNSLLHSHRFINTVVTALMVQEFDWARQFINNYSIKLSENKTATIALAKMYWHHHYGWRKNSMKDLHIALECLDNAERAGLNEKLRIEPLRLRIYYDGYPDMKYTYSFIMTISNNFSRFLDRDSNVSPEQVDRYKQFLHFYRQLIRLKNTPDEDIEKKNKLRQELDHTDNLLFSDWFRQCVKAL